MKTNEIKITERSKSLFISYAKDAGNWSGTPMVDGDKESRGNLTQLKLAGLLSTFDSDGIAFVRFTDLGVEYAASLGITINA